jgi:hypothetical protein
MATKGKGGPVQTAAVFSSMPEFSATVVGLTRACQSLRCFLADHDIRDLLDEKLVLVLYLASSGQTTRGTEARMWGYGYG